MFFDVALDISQTFNSNHFSTIWRKCGLGPFLLDYVRFLGATGLKDFIIQILFLRQIFLFMVKNGHFEISFSSKFAKIPNFRSKRSSSRYVHARYHPPSCSLFTLQSRPRKSDLKCFLDKVIIVADSSNCTWFWYIHNIERAKRNYSHRRLSYRHFTFPYLGCCTKRTVYFENILIFY